MPWLCRVKPPQCWTDGDGRVPYEAPHVLSASCHISASVIPVHHQQTNSILPRQDHMSIYICISDVVLALEPT